MLIFIITHVTLFINIYGGIMSKVGSMLFYPSLINPPMAEKEKHRNGA